MRKIASEERGILYISHKLEEVRALCDRATILRHGKTVDACIPAEETARSLAEKMIGQKIEPLNKNIKDIREEILLEVDSLEAFSDEHHGVNLTDINFSVHGGEIVGIAGIAGNGQVELMGVLSGETGPPKKGEIKILGKRATELDPVQRRLLEAVFVPEKRLGHAAVSDMSLIENSLLTSAERMHFEKKGLVDWSRVKDFSTDIIHHFDVRTTGEESLASSLSGGNLQKFIVGREIMQKPRLIVVAQPTWGVDAGAATAIHKKIQQLVDLGAAVLLISQDLDEIFLLCDRIAVISQGTLSKPTPVNEMTPEQVGLLMGLRHDRSNDAIHVQT